MPRAFIFVLDSFGIGAAPDAAKYGDEGSDTFGHIAAATPALSLPNMYGLGLRHAWHLAHGRPVDESGLRAGAFFGAATETSVGKDTPSGHWEMAGVPAKLDFAYFPDTVPAFPAELTDEIIEKGFIPGILANRHASGTEVIATYGEDHMRTGKPIFYTSSDSVIQIAAHEEAFGLERLYELCRVVRKIVDPLNVGRVIARPFVGDRADNFTRTPNRKDFSMPPPEPTILDRVEAAGRRSLAVGKIGDIFAHRGITKLRKAAGNMAQFDVALEAMDDARDGDFVFANFVDFDTEYGHRRDIPGYARALEEFDRRLPETFAKMRDGDLLILTADHGCDPSWRGTDHTRERAPIMGFAAGPGFGSVGVRPTFADIAETVAAHLGIDPGPHGTSFLPAARA
jgi:phosphopentomutase